MGLSKDKIASLVHEAEHGLLTADKIKFSLNSEWPEHFLKVAGIYVIYEKEELVYFGETGNIKGRMKDLRRTVNHSFRRSLGFKLFHEKATSKKKFSPENEERLNNYFEENIELGFIEIAFGRLEIEEYLVHKYGDRLINKKKKRK